MKGWWGWRAYGFACRLPNAGFMAQLHQNLQEQPTVSSKLRHFSSCQTLKVVCPDFLHINNSFSAGLNSIFVLLKWNFRGSGGSVHYLLFAYTCNVCVHTHPYTHACMSSHGATETPSPPPPGCGRTTGRSSPCHQLLFAHQCRVVVTGHKSSWLPTPNKIHEPHPVVRAQSPWLCLWIKSCT